MSLTCSPLVDLNYLATTAFSRYRTKTSCLPGKASAKSNRVCCLDSNGPWRTIRPLPHAHTHAGKYARTHTRMHAHIHTNTHKHTHITKPPNTSQNPPRIYCIEAPPGRPALDVDVVDLTCLATNVPAHRHSVHALNRDVLWDLHSERGRRIGRDGCCGGCLYGAACGDCWDVCGWVWRRLICFGTPSGS
jgi:hypothetical protein